MKYLRWIILGTLIAGVLSGPSALEVGAATQPQIEWPDIPFAFFGSAFGIVFVIGVQLFRRDSKPSLWGLYFFALVSLWFVTSGLSAAILAIVRGSVAPSSFIIFAVGAGALLGVWASWLMFRRRFKNVL